MDKKGITKRNGLLNFLKIEFNPSPRIGHVRDKTKQDNEG